MILLLLSYVGMVSGFVLMMLAIASGLYYLSEQVEEHTVPAKRMIVRLIVGIIGTHVLLVVIDRLPFWKTLFSVFTNGVYLQTLRQFPLVQLTSTSFILACICALANNWIWFRYFSDPNLPPYSVYQHAPNYQGPTHPPFNQIASFLGILVLLVPLLLFISLSAGDNVLPTSQEPERTKPKRKGLAKDVVERSWAFVATVANTVGIQMSSPYDDVLS